MMPPHFPEGGVLTVGSWEAGGLTGPDWLGDHFLIRCARGGYSSHPTPNVLLAVRPARGEAFARRTFLGETFTLGNKTWRLADIDVRGMRLQVTLRLVDGTESQEPPRGRMPGSFRLTETADGGLSADGVAALESELGTALPPDYRFWLTTTNGGFPAESYRYGATPLVLTPRSRMLGRRPERPELDLGTLRRGPRDPRLPEHFVVIGVLEDGALLTVDTSQQSGTGRQPGIGLLPPTGGLLWVRRSMMDFVALLQPLADEPTARVPLEPYEGALSRSEG